MSTPLTLQQLTDEVERIKKDIAKLRFQQQIDDLIQLTNPTDQDEGSIYQDINHSNRYYLKKINTNLKDLHKWLKEYKNVSYSSVETLRGEIEEQISDLIKRNDRQPVNSPIPYLASEVKNILNYISEIIKSYKHLIRNINQGKK